MTSTEITLGIDFLHVGGPTALIEIGGVRVVTDPTFSAPGTFPVGERALTKYTGPALDAASIQPVDVVLLSHHQHPDNLDPAGRELIDRAPLTLSTISAAAAIDAVTGLTPWEATTLAADPAITVTAVPALHGSEELSGPVIGFVLSGTAIPTVYISGDNSSVAVVEEIVGRVGRIDLAVLFVGAARRPDLDDPLTLTAEDAVTAARLLGDAVIVPIHAEGWLHFTEGPGTVARAFREAGLFDRLRIPLSGKVLAL
ncbi:MBL fold metallo-hydrolase [Gordonia soli]|uniref:Metallo-beta-lactamase domain-containing protein n=1 Tax=Gordonia soli NBRC 108243 TaxID=1223545 RepID=M0QG70_9ACTN|nr:MBL fold metallo-hydrolase [Gordonia soli]GAC66372.1 hypothetical protein GS4_02_00820 [Gordonia soli NBRC 108243]